MDNKNLNEKKRVEPLYYDLKKRREQRSNEERIYTEYSKPIGKTKRNTQSSQRKKRPKPKVKKQTIQKGKILEYRKPAKQYNSSGNIRKKPQAKPQSFEEQTFFQKLFNEIVISAKLLVAIGLIGIAVFAFFMFISPNSYQIYIGDYHVTTIPQGLISEEDFLTSMTAVISNRAETNIYVLEEVRFRAANTRGETVSIDQALSRVTSSLSYLVEAGTFTVNGIQVSTVASESHAYAIIEQIAKGLISPNSTLIDVQLENGNISTWFTTTDSIISQETALAVLTQTTRELRPHVVATGESFWSIATLYGITIEDILDLNPSLVVNNSLQVGQAITVPVYVPFLNITTVEQYQSYELIPPDQNHFTNEYLPAGVTNVVQIGVPGQIRRVYNIQRLNGIEQNRELIRVEYASAPVPYIIEIGI